MGMLRQQPLKLPVCLRFRVLRNRWRDEGEAGTGKSGGKNEHRPPILKEVAKPPKPKPHRRCEVSLGDTMKTARLFQILMFAGTLVASASASDDSLPPIQSTAGQYIFAETIPPQPMPETTAREANHHPL